MTFVTMKHPGYCLFTTTPSERVAIGLTDDQQRVHLCVLESGGWRVAHDWPVSEHSHTEVLLRLGHLATEPASVDELARVATGA